MAMTMATVKLWSKVKDNLNFFRVHVLFFTFTPLVFSAIFYAANGANHVPYIDALFSCFSAGVVCGLLTVDLSSLTGFQQAILFVQAAMGSPVVVSWVMVYIRRRYFNKRLEYIVDAEIAKRKALAEQRALEDGSEDGSGRGKLLRRLTRAFSVHPSTPGSGGGNANTIEKRGGDGDGEDEKKKSTRSTRPALRTRIRNTQGEIRPDAIVRMDDAPRRVDPSGWASDSASSSQTSTLRNDNMNRIACGGARERPQVQTVGFEIPKPESDLEPKPEPKQGNKEEQERASLADGYFGLRVESPAMESGYRPSMDIIHDDRTYIPPGGAPLRRRPTAWTTHTRRTDFGAQGQEQEQSTTAYATTSAPAAKNRGYGGFPYPTTLLLRLLRRLFPRVRRGFTRSAALILTRTWTAMMSSAPESKNEKESEGMNPVQYFSDSFNALIGRNSKFYSLTEENLEELGGVEYRALNALLWILPVYHFAVQLVCFTIIAPYMSIPRWKSDFTPPNLHRSVPPVWYAAFQVVAAYSTSGMSLVDQSMVPFQEAYPLIFVCTFLILAGNLAFVSHCHFVALRFFIWSIMKLVPSTRLNETLHFLLDHPRRCYIYLFPSHQTWLLLWVVLLLNGADFFFFLVLNIGESTFEVIPLGVRFAIGVLQSTSVRAAGFATTSLSSLAPALQVVYVIGMYLGVYPIALSVHATNVYEEKSLGVFEEEDEDDEEPKVEGSGVAFYGRYLAWHARKQLAFDMWWLGLALFLLCVIERGKIKNQDNFQWFTIFSIIFDLISAYSGVGMSLGVPYGNFSSGAFTPLSKFIMIAVMVRGRHRGLPVAIDRAVMLPFEFKKADPARGGGDGGGIPAEGAEGGEEGGDGVSVIINAIIGGSGDSANKRRTTKKEG